MTDSPSGDHQAHLAISDPIAATLFSAADAAGAMLRDYYLRNAFVVDTKGQDDVVTSADRAAEALIVQQIRARFPEHRIVAEEVGLFEGSGDITWYVDPLDGTLNYANHLGSWSTCLAADGPEGIIAAAVVDPLYGEAFRTTKQLGATCNGDPIRVRRLPPARAIVHAYVGGAGPWQQPATAVVRAIAPRVRRLRILGSLALALAYVAAGRLDGVVQLRASAWDYMAGAALVRAAGGVVTGTTGQPISAESGGIVAAGTPELHALLLETVLSQQPAGA